MPLTVFVTDGDQRSALAVARSLGRRGHEVIVGADRPRSLASASNCCARHVTYPSPDGDPDGFERFLAMFVAREQVDVLMPVSDVAMDAVCRGQDRLKRHCALAVPSFEAYDLVTNKARLVSYAERCGVPVPRTHVVAGRAQLHDVVDQIRYPAVVKPAYSRIRTAGGWIAGAAHYASSSGALQRLFDDHDYLASHPSLVQERVSGIGVGLFVLFDRGQLVAEFSHRRLREKPPSGGASVLSQSAAVDPRLRDYAVRMLGPLGWHGVAMMEYKQDPRSGKYALIEINGRFWGSLQLAVDAGVDFPYLTCQLAGGVRPEPVGAYTVGVRSRWLLGDLDHLLLRLFRNRAALGLPDDAPSKWQAVLDFITSAGPDVHCDVASAADWRPFAYELRQYARGRVAGAPRPARRGAADR